MISDNNIIDQTKKWISNVVIGLNFCPFAAKPTKQNSIDYIVENSLQIKDVLKTLILECNRLLENPSTETSFIILPNGFDSFLHYLDLIDLCEQLIEKEGLEGVFQIASFHPLYLFAGTPETDAANYTNRSPYPMLHILREDSLDKALEAYPDSSQIPEKNVLLAREKGLAFMKTLRNSSF